MKQGSLVRRILGSSARWAGSIDPFYMTFVVQKHPLLTTYGTGVYIRNPLVPSHHSARKLGGDHISRHREETLPTRSEEEQTVVKTLQAKQF